MVLNLVYTTILILGLGGMKDCKATFAIMETFILGGMLLACVIFGVVHFKIKNHTLVSVIMVGCFCLWMASFGVVSFIFSEK